MKDMRPSSAQQWGLPDWRDKASYVRPLAKCPPSLSRLAILWWKWQFLRRQPTYRELWFEKVLPFVNAAGEFDAETEWRALEKATAPLRPRRTITAAIKVFEDKFGIHPPADPRDPGWVPFFDSHAIRIESTLPKGISHGELDSHEIAIVFNTKFPLRPQLLRAEQYLNRKELGWPATRAPLRLFPTYLRVLDADEAGVPDVEIADLLVPNPSKDVDPVESIRNWRRAARGLRDSGYRLL